jgi:hypothetical protein
VQYLECKTWREALPMAMAWVAVIEAGVAVASFFCFFVLLRFRDVHGKVGAKITVPKKKIYIYIPVYE